MSGKIFNECMRFVPKSWGYESWIVNNEKYCGKILFIKQGQNCSFHAHHIKDEVLFVQSGRMNFISASVSDVVKCCDQAFIALPDFCKQSAAMQKAVLQNVLKKELVLAGQAWHVETELYHQMVALEDTTIIEFSTQHFDLDSDRLTTINLSESDITD